MSPAVLRKAGPQDTDVILQLDRATSQAPHWSEAAYREILAAAATPTNDLERAAALRRVIFVADAEGTVAGFAVGAVAADELELESVVVDARMRRQGLAALLCLEVTTWAAATGARVARLEVRASNGAAQALYKKLGFEQAGRRQAYYAGPVEDALILVKSLQSSHL